jgi:hypothetical protein
MFCPGLPPKMLLVDDVTTNEQTSDMAAHGRCLIVCSLCFIIVNIEIVSFMLRACVRRKLSCIRQDHLSCQDFSRNYFVSRRALIVASV